MSPVMPPFGGLPGGNRADRARLFRCRLRSLISSLLRCASPQSAGDPPTRQRNHFLPLVFCLPLSPQRRLPPVGAFTRTRVSQRNLVNLSAVRRLNTCSPFSDYRILFARYCFSPRTEAVLEIEGNEKNCVVLRASHCSISHLVLQKRQISVFSVLLKRDALAAAAVFVLLMPCLAEATPAQVLTTCHRLACRVVHATLKVPHFTHFQSFYFEPTLQWSSLP